MAGRRTPVTAALVNRLALALPETELKPHYGMPSFMVAGKFFARLRDDDTVLVVRISFEDRDLLMRAKPAMYFTTDHYRNYPAVLVRLALARQSEIQELLELAWAFAAPKRRTRKK